MLLDKGLDWLDYPNNVQAVSPVTLMLLGKTIEPNLLDENTPK